MVETMKTFEECKKIEQEFKDETIDFAEFERRLAYVALESIDELRFRQEPTPPDQVQEYRGLSKDQQKKATEEGFWREGAQWLWLEESRMIWGLNRGNLARLLELKRIISKDDLEAQKKIEKELRYYTDFIRRENERAKSMGFEIRKEAPKENLTLSDVDLDMIAKAGNIFGGEIV